MILILSVFFLFSVLHAEGQKEGMKINIAVYRGPTGFGMIKLFEEKPDLGPGITTTYSVLPGPADMAARTASGEVDIAVFPLNLASKLYTKGPGYKLGAVSGNGLLYMLSRDADISGWNDLAGKTVYSVGKGATPDYLLRYFLEAKGLSDENNIGIDFSFNKPPQLVQIAAGKKADTVLLPEPFATQLLLLSPDMRRVIDFQKTWMEIRDTPTAYPISAVVINPELLESNPGAVKRFLNEYRDSIEWVNTHPEEAAVLIEKFGILSAEAAGPAIPACNLVYISADQSMEAVEDFLSVLLDFDPVSIGGVLPDAEFYIKE